MKILAELETERQRVTLMKKGRHVALLINGCLQFHSGDQAPLHELLVTLPMCLQASPRRVLVLGGGIGLTAREALRFTELEKLVLVEIDPQLCELTRTHPVMRALHGDAFLDPRVVLVIGDAFQYVRRCRETFDLVVNAIDVSYTPQESEMGEQAIRALWTAERALLAPEGWLSDCINDVELGEYFGGDLTEAASRFPEALGEGMPQAISAYFKGSHSGEHLFAGSTLDSEPVSLRRPVPASCAYLDDRLVRRFLKRGFLPGQRP